MQVLRVGCFRLIEMVPLCSQRPIAQVNECLVTEWPIVPVFPATECTVQLRASVTECPVTKN